MKWVRYSFVIFIGSLFTVAALLVPDHKITPDQNSFLLRNPEDLSSYQKEKLQRRIKEILQFTIENHFNATRVFLIDMEPASGKNRFFIYNLQNDSVESVALVTHGRCNEDWLSGRRYSNEVGGGCTSLGKYKIGKSYKGRFGLAYKLTGLDSSNGNAFRRYVVLHSHECVPDKEVDPYPICQSDGCPTVSPGFLKRIAGIIDISPKPILLYIFE